MKSAHQDVKTEPASRRPVLISGGALQDDKTSITITNYGLSIDEDEVETIFEQGERGRRPKALTISGTGVGLHLARKIMQRQGGNLILLQRTEPVKFAMILPDKL